MDKLGYTVKTPDWMPDGYELDRIELIDGKLFQMVFSKGENDTIIFRAQKGIENISGDYNPYTVNSTLDASGVGVNVGGNQEGLFSLATWTAEGMSFSLSFDTPVSGDEIQQIVESLI